MADNLRKFIDIVDEAGTDTTAPIYLSNDRAKSVSLAGVQADIAATLRDNLHTLGRFEFRDDGEEWFSYTNPLPQSFINAAKDAAKAYSNTKDTKFARLVLARVELPINSV